MMIPQIITLETKEEYCQTLQQVIKVIKENNLPNLFIQEGKYLQIFIQINYTEKF